MRSQRLPDAAPCLAGSAENPPFDGQSFDAAMAVCTVHHWQDPIAGLREIAFQGLAMRAMFATPQGEFLPDLQGALYSIWAALTDEMDAPGRGSPDQDAASVRHMSGQPSLALSGALAELEVRLPRP